MKTLFLARHAKSSWELPEIDDLDRPLMEKGLIRSQKTIAFLLKNNVNIDLTISSHAKRAIETAKLYAHALKYPIQKIEINTSIYASDTEQLFSIIYGLADETQSIMLVGHNPTMTQFSNCFVDKPFEYMPTSAIVSVEFDTNKWTEIELSKCKTNFIFFPQKI